TRCIADKKGWSEISYDALAGDSDFVLLTANSDWIEECLNPDGGGVLEDLVEKIVKKVRQDMLEEKGRPHQAAILKGRPGPVTIYKYWPSILTFGDDESALQISGAWINTLVGSDHATLMEAANEFAGKLAHLLGLSNYIGFSDELGSSVVEFERDGEL